MLHLFVIFLFIAVTVTVTEAVFTSIAITVLATVSIAIAVLALVHVEVIDDGGQLREYLILLEVVDIAESGFGCVIGTANHNAYIGHMGNDGGVGYQADRGCIETDIVLVLLQLLNGFIEDGACHEFGRIRRHGTTW